MVLKIMVKIFLKERLATEAERHGEEIIILIKRKKGSLLG
jgi:hypothetical protein